MQEIRTSATARQSRCFLLFYALAVAGGAIAYIPLLTVLLPVRALELAGTGALNLLALAAFAGAISASIANIGFGWVSDMTRARRRWIALGMLSSTTLLSMMPHASSPAMLVAMIVCWQIGLNMMLAPLAAWAGDSIPDSQKGLLGGLLALAPAFGALSGALITSPGFMPDFDRHTLVALMVLATVSPALLFGRPVPMPQLTKRARDIDKAEGRVDHRSCPAKRMWLARLLVQIAEASLFVFLLLWFRSVAPDFSENDAARMLAIVLGITAIPALALGRWSDIAGRPILPLIWCAAIAALGLIIMASAAALSPAIIGYVIFGTASGIFLALHSSQTLRILSRPDRRGRDLGVFNLTNTVPSLIMPWLTLAMVPLHGFGALFLVLAGLALIACLLLLTIRIEHRR